MTTTTIEFNTTRYEMSHARAPRGRGYWGFCPREHYNANNYIEHTFFAGGTYTEARAAAAAHFRTLGITEIIVCP